MRLTFPSSHFLSKTFCTSNLSLIFFNSYDRSFYVFLRNIILSKYVLWKMMPIESRAQKNSRISRNQFRFETLKFWFGTLIWNCMVWFGLCMIWSICAHQCARMKMRTNEKEWERMKVNTTKATSRVFWKWIE